MSRNQKEIMLYLVVAIVLMSCTTTTNVNIAISPTSILATVTEDVTPTPQSSLIVPSVQSNETAMDTYGTPATMPTRPEMIYNPNQETDGILSLSITEVDNSCFKPGDQIPLMLNYQNMTNGSLIIADYNIISSHFIAGTHGRLIPLLTTYQNERLVSIEDTMSITLFSHDPTLFQTLPPNSSFDAYLEYSFPKELALADDPYSNFQTPPAGQYFLKFVYLADGYEGSWKGTISSNRVELCVVN